MESRAVGGNTALLETLLFYIIMKVHTTDVKLSTHIITGIKAHNIGLPSKTVIMLVAATSLYFDSYCKPRNPYPHLSHREKFEDTKGFIRNRKSKNIYLLMNK